MSRRRHREERQFPYTPRQVYDLVAAVESYPEFLPWCRSVRIREKSAAHLLADLIIGFKMVRERFTSRVRLDSENLRIDVEYVEGPFRHLENHWRFHSTEDGGCRVEFFLEFEFASAFLNGLIGLVFHEAVRRMVGAFETRARRLYGDKAT